MLFTKIATKAIRVTFIVPHYTLNSVTGNGHVKYQENPLACKLHRNSAWKMISFYLLYSQLSLVHGMSTGTKHDKWSYKSKKGTGHVFYMATPSNAIESVLILELPL